MGRRLDDYAKNQRRIRSLQPKVSSEEGHAQARKALAEAGQPSPPPSSPPNSTGKAGQLLRWAQKNRRLIDRRLEERLVSIGGVEHEVFLDDATGRWIKMTMPGKGGKELHAREDERGVRPTLITEDALPASYLRRLVLANRRLGDDFWLHGVLAHPAGPRMVVSQKHIRGEPASSRGNRAAFHNGGVCAGQ